MATTKRRSAKARAEKPILELDERATLSSGNVFADLGFENPEEELAKSRLVSALYSLMKDRGIAEARIAELLEIDQPAVSRLLRGRTSGFTIDRLTGLLRQLGYDGALPMVPTMPDPTPEQ